jgi:ribosomal protein S19
MAPRSTWKLPHVSNKLTERISQNHFFSDLFDQQTTRQPSTPLQSNLFAIHADRFSTVTSDMIGAKVMIHNGSGFRVLKVRKEHLGLKYGEFAYTRTPVKHKVVVAKKAPTKK